MPPPSKPLFLPIIILLAVAILVFSPALVKWEPVTRLFSFQSKKPHAARADAKVWVHKQSGFYYCADSPFFGKVQPGVSMSQGEALQTGYRPIAKDPCR